MASAVVMPRAGISVESCIIGEWKKSPGDSVSMGEVLFDYETDKASFECESTAEGTLLECFFESGDEVPCLVAVCAIGAPGEDSSALRPSEAGETSAAGEAGGAVDSPKPSESAPTEVVTPVAAGKSAAGVTPRARQLAEQLGLDPGAANPTGPRDRVIARDIEALAKAQQTGTGFGGRSFGEAASAEQPAASAAPAADYADEKFTTIRKAIAATMRRSLSEMAQLTHHHSFDASALLAFRKSCKAGGETLGTGGISLNDMILFAVSRTLMAHPDLNAHLLNGDTLRRFSGVNLGVAVDTPRGLMVPTLFGADQMSLKEISDRTKELAGLCQSGSISPDLLQGGTFTVSNLGVLGVEMFTPIVNPPQVAILGVCGIGEKVRAGKNGVETYPSMGLSLTYDHCAVDGAPASRFMRDLCEHLAQFDLLLAL